MWTETHTAPYGFIQAFQHKKDVTHGQLLSNVHLVWMQTLMQIPRGIMAKTPDDNLLYSSLAGDYELSRFNVVAR